MTKKVTEIKDMEGLVNRMLVVSADSTVYKKIAAYIEQYYMQIIFMTAGELALQLSVSQGSVSKFCIALGYRGYADFLRTRKGQKILFLELGVGYNTPVIIKYPFLRMTAGNPKATYACINMGQASTLREIEERSILIDGDIAAVIEEMKKTASYK